MPGTLVASRASTKRVNPAAERTGSLARTHEAQQEEEHVDEVEVEVERAQHHCLARPFGAPVMGILGLQPLRVISGQTGKDQHPDEADHIMHRRRLQPDRSEEHTSELQSLMRISYA